MSLTLWPSPRIFRIAVDHFAYSLPLEAFPFEPACDAGYFAFILVVMKV